MYCCSQGYTELNTGVENAYNHWMRPRVNVFQCRCEVLYYPEYIKIAYIFSKTKSKYNIKDTVSFKKKKITFIRFTHHLSVLLRITYLSSHTDFFQLLNLTV